VLSPFVQGRQQRLLGSQMRSLTDQGPASVLEWQPRPGDPVALLIIPVLSLQTVVVQGTDSSATMAGPGHYAPSPLPGRPGNSVIMGRRTTFGSPFRNLDLLHPGDEIEVDTGIGAFKYRVTSIQPVGVGSVDPIGAAQDNQLTLVTSDPPVRASGRLAVVAALEGDPAAQPVPPSQTVSPSDMGLSGERSASLALLVWAELLIVAIVAIRIFRRGLPPRVVWLLGTPIVFALAWGTYVSLARLLPATL